MKRALCSYLKNTLIISSLFTGAVALASEPVMPDIEEGALGVLLISNVRIGNLVLLKGKKGEGRYLTRDEHGALCVAGPVKFIAGGFTGHTVGVQTGPEISIDVYSETVSTQLLAQKEIVSDDYHITLEPTPDADLVLSEGLSLEEGFILHPRPLWSSWLRFSAQSLNCTPKY